MLFRWWRRRADADVDAELHAHLRAREEHLISQGWTQEAAHAEALRRFGDLPRGREAIREAGRSRLALGWTDAAHDIGADLRYAMRGLARRPGLALAMAATLALGLGVAASVFRVADAALLRAPAGVRAPRELQHVVSTIRFDAGPPMSATMFSYGDAEVLAAHGTMYVVRPGTDAGGRQVGVAWVDGQYIDALGLRLLAGRGFTREEGIAGADQPAAIVSARYWRDTLARAAPGGRAIVTIGGRPFPLVGVMPDDFSGLDLDPVDVWLPMGVGQFGRAELNGVPIPWYRTDMMRALRVVARVARGADTDATAARLSAALNAAHPDQTDVIRTVQLNPVVPVGGASIKAETRAILLELSLMALVLVGIAGANAANLMLARGLGRQQEIATRLAIGASRVRVARLLTIESLLLAGIGAGAAIVAGLWTSEALRRLLFPDSRWTTAAHSDHATAVTAALAIGAGLLAGLVPAIQTTSPNVIAALKQRANAGGRLGRRTRRALVIAQTALSFALIVASGLLVRSLVRLNDVPLGFDPAGLVTAHLENSRLSPRPASATAGALASRLAAGDAPGRGVAEIALASIVPFGATATMDTRVIGSDYEPPMMDAPRWAAVDHAYFRVMRTPILSGRAFGPEDSAASEGVAIINRAMRDRYFPTGIPANACIQVFAHPCLRIVGVAESVRDTPNGDAPPMRFYFPLAQHDAPASALLARTTPAGAADVAAAIRGLLPPGDRATVEVTAGRVALALRPWRAATWLFGALGLVALLLAGTGTYSVIRYMATERAPEMRLRLVLGAPAVSVMRLIVSDGLSLTAAGLVLGAVAAGIGGRSLSALLFGVTPFDPVTYLAAAGVITAAGLSAVALPALAAARTPLSAKDD
jgi:predicted permease